MNASSDAQSTPPGGLADFWRLATLRWLGALVIVGAVAAAAAAAPIGEVVHQHVLTSDSEAPTVATSKVIHQYALTSANDFPQRDPQNWRLLASNDGGRTWTTLDIRTNEVFEARQQRKLYKIDNQTAYNLYRLQIDKVRNPIAVGMVQLAEIELMGGAESDHDPTPVFADIISTPGDNPPAETVANLFDGRVETKWLDWAPDVTTRASWVQWQYVAPTAMAITNVSQLQTLPARAGSGIPVRLQAVVVGRDLSGHKICLVDTTGCMEFQDITDTENCVPGQTVCVTGISHWFDHEVGLQNGRAEALPSEPMLTRPERIVPGQALPPGENFQWVEVEGEIKYLRPSADGLSFDVQDGVSSIRVHLVGPDNSLPALPSGTRVSVSGVCQGAFNEQGEWTAGRLWAEGAESVVIHHFPREDPAAAPNRPDLSTNAAVLTTVEQIRRLTPGQLKAHPRVRIHGVITDELEGFVQDETSGIEAILPWESRRKINGVGDYIDLDGWAELTEVGSPAIAAEHIVVLGPGKLPQPQKLSLSQLAGSQIDGQWIAVEGVVRATDGAHLLITSYGQQLMATLTEAPAREVNELVDADVRVRGVGVTSRDNQGRIQGIHLLIPSLDYVDVVAPPAKAADLPVRKIGTLLGLSGPMESFHRVKVEGVVTLEQNQKVFLRDDTGSAMAILKQNVVLDAQFGRSRWLYWQTPQSETNSSVHQVFYPGQRVQAVGFTETHRYSPVLTEATITLLGDRQAIDPVALTTDGVAEGYLDSYLVTFDGVLREQTAIGPNIIAEVEWQDRTLQVFTPRKLAGFFNVENGSRLRVAGICQIDPPSYPELGLVAGPIRILTRAPTDLVVLSRPSWWTARRALLLAGGMTLATLAGLIWIRELRRQVEERTAQLSVEIRLRERAEGRHALEHERARIAKDLHDDLGANLAQIIFLSERVEDAHHDGQESGRWFDLIPATARRTIQSLDEIVWAVNPQHDSLESLANYISQFAQQYLELARVRCVLEIPTVLPAVPLSAEVRHNLLLTVREALQNAVTHAGATEVCLSLKLDEDGLHIAVADHGKGFDPVAVPPGGNGLQNMRHRLQTIGGQLEVLSRPGSGTTIRLFVPGKLLHGRVIGNGGTLI